jgi:hypothetical protein
MQRKESLCKAIWTRQQDDSSGGKPIGMPSRREVAACAKRINRSVPTVWRWIKAGCRIDDPRSIEAFQIEMERKKTNIARSRERRGIARDASPAGQHQKPGAFKLQANGETPAAGRRGAQHTLTRLEQEEQESFRRLQSALQGGDRFEIDACQSYWLKVAETLRRSDASIDLARRQAETQIPLRQAEDAVTFCAEWMRIAVTTFVSAETGSLMAIKDSGEFRYYFGQRFKGILDLVLKNADRTCSAIPPWAKERIKTAWNVQ